MKVPSTYVLLLLTVLLACKTGQNQSFIKSKKERQVTLTGAHRPYVVFSLQTGDTLKFSSRDIYSILDNDIKRQVKTQGYLACQSWKELADILKTQTTDTLVFQNLSAVTDKTISGILDTWIARELLLDGKVSVVLKGQADSPKKLKYVFLRDNLGGQQGNFYTDENKLIYWTIIALGE